MALSFADFASLARSGHKRIPVIRTLFADLDSPVSTYIKIGNLPYSYLLESVQDGKQWSRYSFIGMPAKRIIKVVDNKILELINPAADNGANNDAGNDKQTQIEERVLKSFSSIGDNKFSVNPLDYITQIVSEKQILPSKHWSSLPPFWGGFVGYFAYECAAYSEKRLARILDKEDRIGCPSVLLMQSDEIIAFDNLLSKIMLISNVDLEDSADIKSAYEDGQRSLDKMEQILASPLTENKNLFPSINGYQAQPEDTKPSKNLFDLLNSDDIKDGENYQSMVAKIKDYIYAGDVMQVVPSQRMEIDYPRDPLDFYRALRTVNPAPYMFYLHLDDFVVAGASPEIMARLESQDATIINETAQVDEANDKAASNDIKRIATLRPIAGTRPRGSTPEEDSKLEQDLLADPKEIAEHLMLIDLGRNDIGRVIKTGSIQIRDKFSVERYSHVMHIVSNISGELKDDLSALDLLRSSLPAGTLTGAPKIRAMEIIDELEDYKRGVYGGALGYLGWQGNMDMCIAIRTAIIKDNKIFLQAGGGIVADSDEEAEWHETLNKRAAMFRAVGILGLDR